MKIISWNIAHRKAPWAELENSEFDLALLQEAAKPPGNIFSGLRFDDEPWETAGVDLVRNWRTAVVAMNDNVKIEWLKPIPINESREGDFQVSHSGTISAAIVSKDGLEPIVVVSMYGLWLAPHKSTKSNWAMADGSVHRLISDITCFIGSQKNHRIIAAGDLNILNGYGELGSEYWARRYKTVFERMKALGIPFIGPQFPNGKQAQPWPDELPQNSKNVPTFHSNRHKPDSATRQLDFVFASESLRDKIKVTAMNDPNEWGPSDHSRILIEVKN